MLLAALAGCAATTTRTAIPDPAERSVRRVADASFLEGSLLQARGRYQDALIHFRRALRMDSTRGAVHYAIARCYYRMEAIDTSLTFARRAVMLSPTNADARMLCAELAVMVGSIEEADTNLVAIILMQPKNVQAHVYRARLWYRRDPARSAGIYEQLRLLRGEDYDLLTNLAELYLVLHDYDKAISTMRRLLTYTSGTIDSYRILTNTLLDAGRYDEALAMVDEIAARGIADSVAAEYFATHMERVADRFRPGSPPTVHGLRAYADALAAKLPHRYGRFWRVEYSAGILQLRLGAPHADALIASSLSDTSAPASVWIEAATWYASNGKYDRAVRTLSGSARRFDDEAEVPYMIGTAYLALERIDSAEHYLKNATAIDPHHSKALSALGNVYDRLGKSGQSEQAFNRALDADPNDPTIMEAYAGSLARRGVRLERALALAKEALTYEPGNERYLSTVGMIYQKLGDNERALGYLRQASAGGADASTLERLGDIHVELGDLVGAREAYEQALELDGGNTELRRKLDSVK